MMIRFNIGMHFYCSWSFEKYKEGPIWCTDDSFMFADLMLIG